MATTIKAMVGFRPVVWRRLEQQRAFIRECRKKGDLPNFQEGDLVLVTRHDFHEDETF